MLKLNQMDMYNDNEDKDSGICDCLLIIIEVAIITILKNIKR